MIADKDTRGNISIMEITPELSKYLVDAIYHYFSDRPEQFRTNTEREVIQLMFKLETLNEKTPNPQSYENKMDFRG